MVDAQHGAREEGDVVTARPSIIVVNWNTRELLARCVADVRRHTEPPFELVIVDNGSVDGSVDVARSLEDASTKTVFLPENRGFAGGNNAGLAVASGDPIVLLNTDAFVTRGWMRSLLRTLDRSGAGMVGPCTNRAKGRQRHRVWFDRFPRPFRRRGEVDYLSFFCVMIRRAVFDAIGTLDERFGIGTFEDDDFCRRARAAGFRLVIDGSSWVWHEAHATFRANSLDAAAVQSANRPIYLEKWERQAPPGRAAGLPPCHVADERPPQAPSASGFQTDDDTAPPRNHAP